MYPNLPGLIGEHATKIKIKKQWDRDTMMHLNNVSSFSV